MVLKFGTSGLRGLVDELVGDPSGIHLRAFVTHLQNSGRVRQGEPIFFGRDLRDSSPEIAQTCMSAAAEAGMVPVDCGALPTPALALHAGRHHAAAVMVTGSHIPADRNGIKFFRPDGEIDKSDEAAIRDLARVIKVGYTAPPPVTGIESEHDGAIDRFRARAFGLLPPGALTGLRIGVYAHSSVAAGLLVDVLSGLGADVVELCTTPYFIAIDTEALAPETVSNLAAWARDYALDAIVSTDADGDRPLVADETGRQLRGDLLGLVAAEFVGARVVVTPVTSNSGISAALGFQVSRTRVGSPYVIAEMQRWIGSGEPVAGFEANGGFMLATPIAGRHAGTLLDALPTRDSMLPILAALGTAAERKCRLSDLGNLWPLPAAESDRLQNIRQDIYARLLSSLEDDRRALTAFLAPIGEVDTIDKLDGLRVRLTSGEIVHLRLSQNAPELRCYVEAATPDRARSLMAQALDRIRSVPVPSTETAEGDLAD